MGVGGHCHTPATLHMGKTWHALCMKLDGPHGWSVWGQKTSPPPGFEPQAVQPIDSFYTGYNMLAFYTVLYKKYFETFCNFDLWVQQSVLFC